MLKKLKKEGFASLVEVIITAVIFILAAFGIFTTISMLRPQGTESQKRLEAVYLGKTFMEELAGGVDASTWNDPSSNLATGRMYTAGPFGAGTSYTINYYLTNVEGLDIRKMHMNVYFSD